MKKTFEYRLYPTDEQKELLSKHFGAVRWVYNYGLNKKIESYKQTGKSLSRYDIQNDLPKLKRQEDTKWLKEINSQSLQATLFHLETAYNRFFTKISSFPKFKNKKSKQSFEIPSYVKIDFNSSNIKIPKFKEPIKCIYHRKFEGDVRTCYIKCTRAGSYYITILVDDGVKLPNKLNPVKSCAVGIDVGIKDLLTTSNGDKIENPRHLIKSERKLKRLQRSLSRKLKRGQVLSNNALKVKKELSKLHEHVANQRKDFLHKTSTNLIRENQTICIEDLNVKDMLKNKYLSKSIFDVGWSMFFSMLEYKSDWYGKNLFTIGRFDPSSKTCSQCGHIKYDLKLSDREWQCSSCHSLHDRDINAAINIRDFAFNRV